MEYKEEESEDWMKKNKPDAWNNMLPDEREKRREYFLLKEKMYETARESFMLMEVQTKIDTEEVDNVWFRGGEQNNCILKVKGGLTYELTFGDDLARDIFKKYMFFAKRNGRISIKSEKQTEGDTEA